jgi:hypothetical protein
LREKQKMCRKFFIEKNNFYVHIKTNVVTNTLTICTLRVSILTYFFAMNSKQKQLKRQNNYAINLVLYKKNKVNSQQMCQKTIFETTTCI